MPLEPCLGTAKRQERKFLAHVVAREKNDRQKQRPAREIIEPRDFRREALMRPNRRGRNEEQEKGIPKDAPFVLVHRSTHPVNSSRSPMFMRVSAPCGHARWHAGPPNWSTHRSHLVA